MLNAGTLREHIMKLVVKQNLPFTFIEVPEFIDLLKLCNLSVEKLLVNADTLTQYIIQRFWDVRDSIKQMFQSFTS